MDTLEPFGNIEPTFMSAQICSIVINSIKSIFSKSDKMFSPTDFMPDWGMHYEDDDKPKPGAISDVDGMKSLFAQLAKASKEKEEVKPKAKTKRRVIK